MDIITRKQAKEQGLKRYFTGKPCIYGHISEHLTSNYRCVGCKVSANMTQAALELRAKHRQNARIKNPERTLLVGARKRDRKIGRTSNITVEDIVIPLHCPVLGIPLIRGDRNWSDNSPTIDRMDNTIGYVKGNIAVISFRANKLKGDATIQELRDILTYMESQW